MMTLDLLSIFMYLFSVYNRWFQVRHDDRSSHIAGNFYGDDLNIGCRIELDSRLVRLARMGPSRRWRCISSMRLMVVGKAILERGY